MKKKNPAGGGGGGGLPPISPPPPPPPGYAIWLKIYSVNFHIQLDLLTKIDEIPSSNTWVIA